jgi:hypothetical protein
MLVVYVFVLELVFPPYGTTSPRPVDPVLIVASVAIGVVASVVVAYTQLRFASDQLILARVLAARGAPIGDPSDSVRPADREERTARRQLRRGKLTRPEYERVIARRHFVHGEITHAEYEELLREIAEQEAPVASAVPPFHERS